MDEMDELADEVFEVLRTLKAGRVLALWRDGSFTVEPFAFFGRPRPDGSIEKPIASFVAGGFDPSHQEVLIKLRHAVRQIDTSAAS